uniref:Uncharacterized protein n=1 Tax=Nothobranchius furzeri TaxID=105023 RepID=A0A8C6MCC4_NOTFU
MLPVQRLLQDQLRELVSVRLRLHVQVKVVVSGDVIGPERVGAHVRVGRALQREPGPRGPRRIVVNRVLQEHLHVELAARALPADLVPVYPLIDEQNPVLQVHPQVRRPGAGHDLEASGGQLGEFQTQVLSDVPHKRAMIRLLRDRVPDLTREQRLRGPLATPGGPCSDQDQNPVKFYWSSVERSGPVRT